MFELNQVFLSICLSNSILQYTAAHYPTAAARTKATYKFQLKTKKKIKNARCGKFWLP